MESPTRIRVRERRPSYDAATKGKRRWRKKIEEAENEERELLVLRHEIAVGDGDVRN